MTEYVVLTKINDGWVQVRNDAGTDVFSASSPQGAIRSVIKSAEGDFVGVPARSWKTVRVKV